MISGLYDAITGKRKTNNYGGLGDYGTYTGQDGTAINVNEDAYNALKVGGVGDGTLSKTPDSGIGSTISRWVTPGEGGASLGGNVLSGVGTAVGKVAGGIVGGTVAGIGSNWVAGKVYEGDAVGTGAGTG